MRIRWLPLCALLMTPSLGLAEEGAKPERDEAKHEEGKEKGEREERAWEASADLAYGSSKIETVGPSGKGGTVVDTSRMVALSFLFGLEREIGEHVVVGARLPLVTPPMDSVQSREAGLLPRSVGPMLGNLELEGGYKHEVVKSAAMEGTFEGLLELALPFAPGTEGPPAADVDKGAPYPYASIDRFNMMRTAGFTRGSLDSALFEPGRFGLVPKVTFPMRFLEGKLRIRPMVKFEALFDTTGKAREAVIGELVMGVRASYVIAKVIEPGVHVWMNATVTDSEEKDLTVAAIEPSVTGHIGPLSPFVGLIVPMAGRLVTSDTLAVRAGVAAAF